MNSIVLEVPITMLTVDGKLHGAGEKEAVIGTYGETERQRITIRRVNGNVDTGRTNGVRSTAKATR